MWKVVARKDDGSNNCISRQAAIDIVWEWFKKNGINGDRCLDGLRQLSSVQPDDKLTKIADLVEGTIDHFDLDDAIDLLYQIKEVLK